MSDPYDVCVVWVVTGFVPVGANSREEAIQAVHDMNDGNGPAQHDAEDIETISKIASAQKG